MAIQCTTSPLTILNFDDEMRFILFHLPMQCITLRVTLWIKGNLNLLEVASLRVFYCLRIF